MKLNKYSLLFIYVASIGLFLSDSVRAQTTILNNNKLRMGNGSQSSVNASGNLQQPFYYNSVQATWRKLTYSVYPLDNAFGIGGDKTNVWNLNGSIVQNPTLSNQVVDRTGFVATTGDNGYGIVVSKGTIQVGGNDLEIQNTYRLPASIGYVEVKVKVKNVSAAPLENVRIWIGTRDDWVGNTDSPLKEKGNLVDGAFEKITNAATRSAALKISTNTEGILFYTNSERGNTIVNRCCSWGNIINQNPETSVIEVRNDGSYGFYVRFNDLLVGESDEFTWYYAAGELSDIDNIIREVASVSAAFTGLSSTNGTFSATSTVPATGNWMVVPRGSTPPTAAQIIAGVAYNGVTPTSHGSEAMAANVEVQFQLSGLSATTEYDFYFVTVDVASVASAVMNAQFATHALPTISNIEDGSSCQDRTSAPIAFTVGDAETEAASLLVSATSSNTALIADGSIVFGGSGANRTISVTPLAGQTGSSTITVTVTDADGDVATDTFVATISVNDVVSPVVVDLSLYENATPPSLPTRVTGSNLLWYAASTGGSGSSTAPVPNTSILDVLEYWVTQTVNGCESSRVKLTVSVIEFLDAPVIITNTTTLPGLVEDVLDIDNTGILISDLLQGTVNSLNGNAIGIAVTSRDHDNGTWQFLESSVWWNFDRHAPASEAQALLLSPGTRIRFLPATHFNGSASFTYRAWDQSTGTDRNIANTTTNGAATAFSETIGTANVSLSSVNDAPTITSLIGVPTVAFDGANDYISFANAGISGDFTLEALIYVTQNQTWSRVMDMANGAGNNNIVFGFFSGSYQLFLESFNGGASGYTKASSSFPTGVWKHVAAVNDGSGTGYLYIDGALVASGPQRVIQDVVRNFNYIAKSNWGQDAYFKGAMREIRIWDVARTQSQINEMKNKPLVGNETGLKVYYRTDENAGTTLTDASGHGIDGTMQNGAAWSTFGEPLSTLIVTEDTDKIIEGFNMVDPDAANNNVTLTINSTHGKIKFLTDVANGLIASDITNNNSYSVAVTSTIAKINSTLLANGFLYSPDLNYNGSGEVDMELSDNGFSGVGGVFSSTYSFDVNVTPVNELPVFTSEPVLSVEEDAVYSYTVTAVDANDPSDVLTFSASVIPSWLTIDPQTGSLTGIPTNDFVGDNQVTVRVFDGIAFVDQSFVIVVSNTNDIPAVGIEQTFTLAENTANGTVVGTVQGYDVDLETTLGMWTIIGGNLNNAFAIDPATGVVTIANSRALDFEAQVSFELVVTVSDGISTSTQQTITINLSDVNEVPVVTENQVLTVDENSANGFVVGSALATDSDEGSTLMGWTIVDGNTNNTFSIDPATGVITVSNTEALDFESIASFELTIIVNDGELTSVPQNVTINLANLNDNTPVITANQSFSVDENTGTGFIVATPAVEDADGQTTYSNWTILDGNINNAFSIDPLTGAITINNSAALDFEELSSYTLTIAVGDGSNSSASQTIVIEINNLNDVKPIISSNISFSVDENKEQGFAVGTLTASDEDGETNFTAWSIVSGNTNNTFRIDPLTGVISVENSIALNFEATTQYTLEITVSDGINTSIAQTVIIDVVDLNEVPVIVGNQMFELMENSPNGVEIGVAVVSDPDGTTTFTNWTITSQDESGVFEIDPLTGKITLMKNAELDFETQPTHTLWITVTDGNGVSNAVAVTITLIDATENENGNPVIFTAFSPNGDGVNDTWNVPNLNAYPNCEMKIFNSDGMELFYNKGYTRQWDGSYNGKEMPLGTYYYLVRLNDSTNTVYKGHFTLIR